MKKLFGTMIALGVSASVLAGAAWAQAPAAAPAAETAAPAAPMTKAEKAAKSKECYAQADAQHRHGKVRKRFHKSCMKGETPADPQ